jgi:ACS family glucarate transporter-like MFS transporter
MEELKFDRVQLGFTMSAFFMGYFVMQIPGGLMAERWGVRKTGMLAMVWWSLFTILTPMAWGFASFMIVRFIFGLGEGPLYPNNSSFFARWFNSREKSLPSALMMVGTFLGPALGPPLTVLIINYSTWHWVFYIYGILGFIIAATWYTCSRNTPKEHPKVNEAELLHITEKSSAEEAAALLARKEVAPWGKFIRNTRFWCFGVQYFTTNYIIYIFLSWIPLYLLEARGMSFIAMGGAAALPWLAICLGMFLTGLLSDRLVARGLNKFFSRGVMGMIGLAGCGIFLYMATTVESTIANVACLSASAFLLGFNYTSSWTGCQDLGQRHGGTVGAWMNTWGTAGGITAPIFTAMLVEVVGWDSTLAISTMVVAVGVICWLFVKPDRPLVEA